VNKKHIRWTVLVAVVLVACNDAVGLRSRKTDAPSLSQLLRPRLLSDDLRDVARRAPGFSGVSVADNGDLVVSATTPELSAMMISAVTDWLNAGGRPDLAKRSMRLRVVPYDYETLSGFMERLRPELRSVRGVNADGIEDHTGRLIIGVDDSEAAVSVRQVARTVGIPENALNVEVFGPTVDVIGLRDVHGTVRGGLAVSRLTNGYCTAGLVGWLKDEFGQPDFSYRMFTTAAHCTSSETQILGDAFGQPLATRRVGVEVDEAIVYPTGHAFCAAVWPDMCRYADVSVVRMDDSVASAAGSVAKSQAVTYPTNPPYNGSQAYVGGGIIGAIPNELVYKVGATTGERSGQLTHNCLNRPSGGTANLTTLCVQRMASFTDDGDSGGTVFMPYIPNYPWGGTPRAVGTIFQKDGTSGAYLNTVTGMNAALANKYYYAW
jgi:hypothetical protein